MKKWILAALLCSVAVTAAGQAPQASVPANDAQRLDEIRVSSPRLLPSEYLGNMWRDEFDEIKGHYRLSTGSTMLLKSHGRRMYAQIGGNPRTQMVAVSPYELVALDESMRMRFDGAGTTNNDVIIEIAVDDVASALAPRYVRLTARR